MFLFAKIAQHSLYAHMHIKRVIDCFNCKYWLWIHPFLIHFLRNRWGSKHHQNHSSRSVQKWILKFIQISCEDSAFWSDYVNSSGYLQKFLFCTRLNMNQPYCGAQFPSDFLRMNCQRASETFNQLVLENMRLKLIVPTLIKHKLWSTGFQIPIVAMTSIKVIDCWRSWSL